jgi:hypothetical protein
VTEVADIMILRTMYVAMLKFSAIYALQLLCLLVIGKRGTADHTVLCCLSLKFDDRLGPPILSLAKRFRTPGKRLWTVILMPTSIFTRLSVSAWIFFSFFLLFLIDHGFLLSSKQKGIGHQHYAQRCCDKKHPFGPGISPALPPIGPIKS